MDTQPDIIISTADLAELEFQLERSKLPAEVIRAIENELDRATIVACKDLPQDVVAIGSQVTFKIGYPTNVYQNPMFTSGHYQVRRQYFGVCSYRFGINRFEHRPVY